MICIDCGYDLPLSAFHKHIKDDRAPGAAARPNNHQSYCRACHKKRIKANMSVKNARERQMQALISRQRMLDKQEDT